MITIPERQLKRVIDYCIKFVRDNYNSAVTPSETYLAAVFEDTWTTPPLKDYDYFQECAAMINRTLDHPRHIETHHFLNRERFAVPTVHITMTGNSPGPDGIGFDKDFNNPFRQDANSTPVNSPTFLEHRETYMREFNTRFQIVCTSDNVFEVLMLYYLLTSCLIGNNELLEANGIRNPRFNGNDIILDESICPPHIYARAIMIDCFFATLAPSFKFFRAVTGIDGGGKLINWVTLPPAICVP